MLSNTLQMLTREVHTEYPRKLRNKEWDLLESVLPADRPGYKHYRDLISTMMVLGEGRRGAGNLVLGFEHDTADIGSPLAPVVAYGMVETTRDKFSITVREYVGEQIDIEIISTSGDEIPDHFEEKRRWTYSTWTPGTPSPSTGSPVREIAIDNAITLAIATAEKRIWVYDGRTGMNHLIPITNFYNELMLHKHIRDPKIALRSALFFQDLDTYNDRELRASFIAYNTMKRRVEVQAPETMKEKGGIRALFGKFLGKKS